MDSSAWIGFSILALVILLLAYVRKASLAHSKKLSKLFNRVNRENKLNITEMISWDSGIIGIDNEKHKLIVVVQEAYHVIDHTLIDTRDILLCEVFHERLPTLTRIGLVFSFKDSNQQSFSICFYNSATDILADMADLKEKAEKVKEIVSHLISKETNKTSIK